MVLSERYRFFLLGTKRISGEEFERETEKVWKEYTWQMSSNELLHSLTIGKWHSDQILWYGHWTSDSPQCRCWHLMIADSGPGNVVDVEDQWPGPGSAQTGTGQLWLTPVQLWWCQLRVMSSHHQNCHNDKHTLRPKKEISFSSSNISHSPF